MSITRCHPTCIADHNQYSTYHNHYILLLSINDLQFQQRGNVNPAYGRCPPCFRSSKHIQTDDQEKKEGFSEH